MSRAGRFQDRWFEILVGVIVLPFALFCAAIMLAAAWSLAVESSSATSDWAMWVGMLAVGLVGSWCAQISWRLITGREREGGGLLSPLVLILFSAGCMAAAIAAGLHDVHNPAWFDLMALAVGCFSFAVHRIGRRRPRRAA